MISAAFSQSPLFVPASLLGDKGQIGAIFRFNFPHQRRFRFFAAQTGVFFQRRNRLRAQIFRLRFDGFQLADFLVQKRPPFFGVFRTRGEKFFF